MTEDTFSKGERTRQSILTAAYTLFVEQGFHATSMRQIANRAGIALGGIYNHFSGKEDLFRSIVLERHPYSQIIPVIKTARGDTIEAYVREAARLLVEELGHHPEFVNLMLIEIVEFKAHHVPQIFASMFPEVIPIGQRLSDLNGEIRPIPLPLLLRAFLGMFFSYYMTELLLGELMPAKMQADAFDAFVEIFLHGILSRSETV